MSENVLVFEHMHSKFTISANMTPIFFFSTKYIWGIKNPNSFKWALENVSEEFFFSNVFGL
jgi:hypothetical protein